MVRTNIYLPETIHQKLQILSKRQKRSMADLVRNYLEKALKEEEKRETGADVLLRMAKRAKKSKGSGLKDVALNHDYYLYGKGRID